MKDLWIVADAVRYIPADFRPVTPPQESVVITIRGTGAPAAFRGPSLFAAVETARHAHRAEHGSTVAPIYSLSADTYRWWDGSTSTGLHGFERHVRTYLSQLYQVPTRNVHIKQLTD